MRKLSALLIALLLVVGLCACGQSFNEPNTGVYRGVSVDILGPTPMDEVYTEGKNELILADGGNGTWTLNGESVGCTWTLDGEVLTLDMDGLEFTGTLKDGVASVDFVGTHVFRLDGASAPADSDGEAEEDTEADDAENADGEDTLETDTVEFNDVKATYTGAELLEDSDGKPAIAIYFDFENLREDEASVLFSLYYDVKQGDTELESAVIFASEDSYDTLSDGLLESVAAGETAELCMTYVLSDESTPVVVTFTNYLDNPIATWTISIE